MVDVLGAFGIAPNLNEAAAVVPDALIRKSSYLEHPIFNKNRSEAEITRYMRKLADRDLALDRAMIPLGSCTMKLNATTEMIPVTWPEFANLHPFVPTDQAEGYAEMIADLNQSLCEITGYDQICLLYTSPSPRDQRGSRMPSSA